MKRTSPLLRLDNSLVGLVPHYTTPLLSLGLHAFLRGRRVRT